MQLAVSSTELLVSEEERVVEKCQGVEDIKFGLGNELSVLCLERLNQLDAYLLRQDQCVLDELIQAGLENVVLIVLLLERAFGRIVEQLCSTDRA